MLNKFSAFLNKHLASILIIFISILASYFVFAESYIYLFNSVKEFCLQIALLFCKIFGIQNSISVPITDIPEIIMPTLPSFNGNLDNIIVESYSLIDIRAKIFISMFLTGTTYKFFGFGLLNFLFKSLIIIMYFIAPLIYLLYLGIKGYLKHYFDINNDYEKVSKPLNLHLKLEKNLYVPIWKFIKTNYNYFRNSIYYKIFIVIMLLNYNVITLLFELCTYILNYYCTFNFINSAMVYKLLYYCKPILKYMPWWLIVILLIKKFNNMRFERAKEFRYHYDNRNKGVIKKLATLFLIKGGPGAGKDFLGTDIALTRETMWKYYTSNLMLKYDTMFPKFDFLKLALYVEELFNNKTIKSLTGLSAHFRTRKALFEIKSKNTWYPKDLDSAQELLFGYDYNNEPMEYCDGIKFISLFSCIENYALSYYIYLMPSTLISNYSVRLDNFKLSFGNMVKQMNDYFAITPEESRFFSHYSLIMNQDDFRLFKKLSPDSKGVFEFGNVVWTEIDKDYGNMLDTQDQELSDAEANSKNDGLTQDFKLIRSAATIDNTLFANVSGTAQRDMNVGINIRDISDSLEILERHDIEYCYLFGNFEMRLFEWITNKYKPFYEKFKIFRGDNNLFMYLFKVLYSKLYRYFDRLQNEYGYIKYDILNGNKEYEYYSFTKKMWAYRYSTDVNKLYFRNRIYDSKTGILDMRSFEQGAITPKEMAFVNSYFFNDLYNLKKNKKQPIKETSKKSDGLTSVQRKFLNKM